MSFCKGKLALHLLCLNSGMFWHLHHHPVLPTSASSHLFAFALPPIADDNATIRVTNLSEDTRETDLQELFRPFGSISRIYLAKDKTTGQSKVRGGSVGGEGKKTHFPQAKRRNSLRVGKVGKVLSLACF